jgi:NAD(P)-dependent dehydrogenase (short-subunit alcohol dehydrogenase family)
MLALEVSELAITVNNIAPGMVLTPFNQQAIDDPNVRERQVQSIPMKRAAEPGEIARQALFLASSDVQYATGATYVMDGGLMQSQPRSPNVGALTQIFREYAPSRVSRRQRSRPGLRRRQA